MAKDPWSDWNDDDPGNFQPGDTIGPYELLFPAAVGGMAAVWAARLRRPNGSVQIVAVKLLSDTMRSDDDARAMFLDEACTASRILHPNVVHILAYGEVRDRPYLAMEWIDGAPIAKIFSNQKQRRALLPLGWVLHVLTAACAGLHAAHEVRDDSGELLNLIHRDVTPENVMVTFDGMVKVVDFGVAKTRARAQVSRVGAIKGKTGYFSPEQVSGGVLDRRSDLFSMGVLLYLLVTGHPPFRGKGPLEAMQQIAHRNPQPPREIMPDVHPELDRIILKALAKNPDERYQTAAELRRDLEQVSAAVAEPYGEREVGALVRDLLPGVAEARKERIDQAIDELDRILAERQHPQKPVASRPEDATEVMLRRISMLPVLQGGPEPEQEDDSELDALQAALEPVPASSRLGPASSRLGPASSRLGPASSRKSAAGIGAERSGAPNLGPSSTRLAGPASGQRAGSGARSEGLGSARGSSGDFAGLPGMSLGGETTDSTNAGAALSEPVVRPGPEKTALRSRTLLVAAIVVAVLAPLAFLWVSRPRAEGEPGNAAQPTASVQAPPPSASRAELPTGAPADATTTSPDAARSAPTLDAGSAPALDADAATGASPDAAASGAANADAGAFAPAFADGGAFAPAPAFADAGAFAPAPAFADAGAFAQKPLDAGAFAPAPGFADAGAFAPKPVVPATPGATAPVLSTAPRPTANAPLQGPPPGRGGTTPPALDLAPR